jgi:hypothetical protein
MKQSRISAIETVGQTKLTIETLKRLASAFDCALAVRFVSFGELGKWTAAFDPDNFSVPSFEDERRARASSPAVDIFDDRETAAAQAITDPIRNAAWSDFRQQHRPRGSALMACTVGQGSAQLPRAGGSRNPSGGAMAAAMPNQSQMVL